MMATPAYAYPLQPGFEPTRPPARAAWCPRASPSRSSGLARRQAVGVVPDGVRRQLAETVVGGPGFTLGCAEAETEVLQRLLRHPPDLLLVYDSGAEPGAGPLYRLLKVFPRPPFPVVVLAEFPGDSYPPAVKAVLPVDFERSLFDRTVADLVGLPTAATGRLLVRLSSDLAGPSATSVLATAHNLGPEGTLLVVGRALTLGAVYQLAVLGLGGGEVALPAVQILREERSPGADRRQRRYVGAFAAGSGPAIQRLLMGLRP